MQQIDSLTDLTLLNEDASSSEIKHLVKEAQNRHVAAVCVYPKHLTDLPNSLRRATVLNFPTGEQTHDTVLTDIKAIIKHRLAEEIDYVFPYTLFLNGNEKEAFSKYQDIQQLAVEHHLLLKVILETGAFPNIASIEDLSWKLIEKNCPFLKTSTGKISIGATHEAARAILTAIQQSNKPCGLKVSGGIRTNEQALSYLHLAENMLHRPLDTTCFRIGRSVTPAQ